MSKVTSFPEGLDTANKLPDIRPSDRMNDDGRKHDVQHTTLNQAVIALQRKVGADDSEDESSLDYKVRQLEEHGSGGSGLTLGNPDGVGGGNLVLPAAPAVWLSAMVGGVEYIVPGYVAKTLIAPDEIGAKFASVRFATRLDAVTDNMGAKLTFSIKFTGDALWRN